jgi:hypothetical protein
MLTPLLIVATLIGAWIVFLGWKHPAPAWFSVTIWAVWGLAYRAVVDQSPRTITVNATSGIMPDVVPTYGSTRCLLASQ